jgi:hypothetical protein
MAKMQSAIAAVAGALVAFALTAGCGGDDNASGGSNPDGGADHVVPPTDAAPPDDAQPGDARSDAGCDFNGFVTGLITNHTNAKDLPSADLGDNCVDTHTPFPQSLFQ